MMTTMITFYCFQNCYDAKISNFLKRIIANKLYTQIREMRIKDKNPLNFMEKIYNEIA